MNTFAAASLAAISLAIAATTGAASAQDEIADLLDRIDSSTLSDLRASDAFAGCAYAQDQAIQALRNAGDLTADEDDVRHSVAAIELRRDRSLCFENSLNGADVLRILKNEAEDTNSEIFGYLAIQNGNMSQESIQQYNANNGIIQAANRLGL